MQLKQLTYFVTVVECGSFRRAAEELYLAQSSLSQAVGNLEKELGFSYAQLDRLLLEGETDREAQEKIERMHRVSEHKRRPAMVYSDGSET